MYVNVYAAKQILLVPSWLALASDFPITATRLTHPEFDFRLPKTAPHSLGLFASGEFHASI
jgi:hypothetical protein